MADEPDEDDDGDSLPLRELARIAGGGCQDCTAAYSAREAVFSIALGFKDAPRCLPCLANRLTREEPELRTALTEYVHRRECYLRAWKEAERMDEQNTPTPASRGPERVEVETAPVAHAPGSQAEAEWDAGDLGCGELVMQLRLRLKNLPAGSVFKVIATDPAAPEDLPAWCRLTGHTMLTADHPVYLIRRRED